MITAVTSDDFKNLVNPYTGEPMKVMMNVTTNGVSFFSPDTYSTADRLPTPEACYRNWNRVNGIDGVRSERPLVCAYTGEPLSVVHTEFGCYYSGGFDPHMFHSREDFLYYATMRNGVAKREKPGEQPRVQASAPKPMVTERAKRHADEQAPTLDEEKISMVEKSVSKFKDSLPGSSTVSMAITGKKHGKR